MAAKIWCTGHADGIPRFALKDGPAAASDLLGGDLQKHLLKDWLDFLQTTAIFTVNPTGSGIIIGYQIFASPFALRKFWSCADEWEKIFGAAKNCILVVSSESLEGGTPMWCHGEYSRLLEVEDYVVCGAGAAIDMFTRDHAGEMVWARLFPL